MVPIRCELVHTISCIQSQVRSNSDPDFTQSRLLVTPVSRNTRIGLNYVSVTEEEDNRCLQKKIELKGETVGLSFYAFFANKNDNPVQLMEAATWWIQTHQLDHFEKAVKIMNLVASER